MRKRGGQGHSCEQRTPENYECSSAFKKTPKPTVFLRCSGILASVARIQLQRSLENKAKPLKPPYF